MSNLSTGSPGVGELARDDAGRLYNPSLRTALAERAGAKEAASIEAVIALRQVARRLHLWMERWAELHGLSEGRLQILVTLWHQPDNRIPLGQLAAHLDVVPRTITGLVDHLERDGLVVRVPDPEDRRSIHAQLTQVGRDRIEAIRKEAIAHQAAFTQAFSQDQLAELRHLCLSLIESLGDPEPGAAGYAAAAKE